ARPRRARSGPGRSRRRWRRPPSLARPSSRRPARPRRCWRAPGPRARTAAFQRPSPSRRPPRAPARRPRLPGVSDVGSSLLLSFTLREAGTLREAVGGPAPWNIVLHGLGRRAANGDGALHDAVDLRQVLGG